MKTSWYPDFFCNQMDAHPLVGLFVRNRWFSLYIDGVALATPIMEGEPGQGDNKADQLLG